MGGGVVPNPSYVHVSAPADALECEVRIMRGWFECCVIAFCVSSLLVEKERGTMKLHGKDYRRSRYRNHDEHNKKINERRLERKLR